MSKRKYVGESSLSIFLQNLKTLFSPLKHDHTISEITDYTVDDALSANSTNPVQNQVLDAEFNAIGIAMGVLEKDIDDHDHNDLYYTQTEINEKLSVIDNLAEKSEIPTTLGELTNDVGYLTDIPSEYITETELEGKGYLTEHQNLDGYAKTDELGNLAVKDTVEKADLSSDVQSSLDKADTALQSYTETDPTVPAWAKEPTRPTYTASDVGADPVGTADDAVSTHNTNTSAHNDIRDLITGLTNRLNALADSDDTTLDQLSEIVAYIKANKDLIDSITTTKVNVADIIDDLTTNVANKPLSAAQGVAIKALIDDLQREFDNHDHNYAGSSSVGGSANSAVKLDSSAGSAIQPVYFSDGKPVETTYTLGKSVPSDAVFTDTTYSVATTSTDGLMSAEDKVKLDTLAAYPVQIISWEEGD